MNHSSLNRWLKPLAIVLVIILIVMVLIPKELTDAELAQIKPGMTLQEAIYLLGKPKKDDEAVLSPLVFAHGRAWLHQWYRKGGMRETSLTASIPDDEVEELSKYQKSTWISKQHLLWVLYENDIITKTWLFPITHTGGGLEGCIETIKQYWNQWWK